MYDDFLARILEPDIFLPSQFYGAGGLSRQLEGLETDKRDDVLVGAFGRRGVGHLELIIKL